MKPCKVCQSPYRPLIEAARQAGRSDLSIETYILDKFGVLVGRFVIATHHTRGHHLETIL